MRATALFLTMRANRSIPGNCSLPTFDWNGKMGAAQFGEAAEPGAASA